MALNAFKMEDANIKWSDLLDKYMLEKITREELAELNYQTASSPVKEQQFKQCTDKDEFMLQLKGMDQFDIDKSWNKLQATLSSLRGPGAVSKKT